MKVHEAAIVPLLLLAACERPTRIEDLNLTEVTLPGGKVIAAETMIRAFDLERGMMFRDSLPKDRGMLFVRAKEDKYPHWTYNCRFPLDILWLDHQRRIVEVSPNTPPCTAQSARTCPVYGGNQKSQYVLELNGGRAEAYGLRIGDTLNF